MAIGNYFIINYLWLLVAIFDNFMLYYDYWWLLYYRLLLDILSYTIIGHWLF